MKKIFPQITLPKSTSSHTKQVVSKEYLHQSLMCFMEVYPCVVLQFTLPWVHSLTHCFHLLLFLCKPSLSKVRLEHPCGLARRAVPALWLGSPTVACFGFFVPVQSRHVWMCAVCGEAADKAALGVVGEARRRSLWKEWVGEGETEGGRGWGTEGVCVCVCIYAKKSHAGRQRERDRGWRVLKLLMGKEKGGVRETSKRRRGEGGVCG